MTAPAQLATRATALLLAVATGRPGAVTAFQTEMYRILYTAARKRARSLSTHVRFGIDGVAVPAVPPSDWDSVAHDVTVHALTRLTQTAARFDPDLGDGLTWALRQVSHSYVDVVRATYQVRRRLQAVPTSDDQLVPVADTRPSSADPALIVEMREQLREALAALTVEERQVTLAVTQQGLTYAETAELLYGDPSAAARVDRVRRAGKRKLQAVETAWRASSENERANEQ